MYTIKQIRNRLGILMLFGVMNLVWFTAFFSELEFRSLYRYSAAMVVFYWMWLPSVMLIGLCYLLLTRVYRYGKKDSMEKQETGNEDISV